MNHLAAPTACGGSAPSPPTTTESPVSGCANPKWKGDSFCDDGNNNAGCSFDGGDCCGNNVNTKYCKICECTLSCLISVHMHAHVQGKKFHYARTY